MLVMLKLMGVLFACRVCVGPTECWNATIKSSLKAVPKKSPPPISLVGAKSDSKQRFCRRGKNAGLVEVRMYSGAYLDSQKQIQKGK